MFASSKLLEAYQQKESGYLASSRGADVPRALGMKEAPLAWAISVPCNSGQDDSKTKGQLCASAHLGCQGGLACCSFRFATAPKLCLLGFFVAAFLGCTFIRCVPLLGPEGALSLRVTFATFASTGVLETCNLFGFCLTEKDGQNWLLRCPTREAEDII